MREKQTLQSNSADQTERLGQDIGGQLKGGEIIELISDLGGGKTTFTRGLVHGAGSTDHVASPTFTVSKVYKAERFDIHHFDFYRLAEAGVIEHELHDLLHDPSSVVVVEWGDIVRHVLPEERLSVEIMQTDAESRDIRLQYPPSLAYLTEPV